MSLTAICFLDSRLIGTELQPCLSQQFCCFYTYYWAFIGYTLHYFSLMSFWDILKFYFVSASIWLSFIGEGFLETILMFFNKKSIDYNNSECCSLCRLHYAFWRSEYHFHKRFWFDLIQNKNALKQHGKCWNVTLLMCPPFLVHQFSKNYWHPTIIFVKSTATMPPKAHSMTLTMGLHPRSLWLFLCLAWRISPLDPHVLCTTCSINIIIVPNDFLAKNYIPL